MSRWRDERALRRQLLDTNLAAVPMFLIALLIQVFTDVPVESGEKHSTRLLASLQQRRPGFRDRCRNSKCGSSGGNKLAFNMLAQRLPTAATYFREFIARSDSIRFAKQHNVGANFYVFPRNVVLANAAINTTRFLARKHSTLKHVRGELTPKLCLSPADLYVTRVGCVRLV